MGLREDIYRRIFQNLQEQEQHPSIFYHGSAYLFDHFDIDKVGTGSELNKFGYGFYFSDTLEQAEYYAYEASRGKPDAEQWIYEVKLFEVDSYLEWEDHIPDHVHHKISNKLREMGEDDEADTMDQEYEDYMETWSMRSVYEILSVVLGGAKDTSEFLYQCGIGGVISDAVIHNAKVYTCFSEDRIKIIDRYPSQYLDDPFIGSNS